MLIILEQKKTPVFKLVLQILKEAISGALSQINIEEFILRGDSTEKIGSVLSKQHGVAFDLAEEFVNWTNVLDRNDALAGRSLELYDGNGWHRELMDSDKGLDGVVYYDLKEIFSFSTLGFAARFDLKNLTCFRPIISRLSLLTIHVVVVRCRC